MIFEEYEKKVGIKLLWVITDTHFDHYKMITSCNRPENFTDQICENWRNMVSPSDTVIHLGDFAWGMPAMEKLLSLPGRKILVRGNHDDKSLERYMSMGWDFAADSIVMNLYGIRILFSHKPRFDHKADINIHGHFHDLHREDFSRLYLPLSLEAMGYRPIALDDEFLGPISSWTGRHYIPKLKEIYDLKQNHRPFCIRDIYGRQGKERFMEDFRKHTGNMDVSDDEILAVLEKHGIRKSLIPGEFLDEAQGELYERARVHCQCSQQAHQGDISKA